MSSHNSTQIITTPQGSNSDTFNLPQGLEDAGIPLPTAWDHHLKCSHSHPLFVYEAAPGEVKTIYWGDAVQAMHRSARIVDLHAHKLGFQNTFSSEEDVGIFGILASTGDYHLFILSYIYRLIHLQIRSRIGRCLQAS